MRPLCAEAGWQYTPGHDWLSLATGETVAGLQPKSVLEDKHLDFCW